MMMKMMMTKQNTLMMKKKAKTVKPNLVNAQMKLRVGAYDTDYQGGTGAGDAFDAGFIAALLQGHDLPTCLRWGSALGASCVRSTSATGSVFNRDEALQFMERHAITVERC